MKPRFPNILPAACIVIYAFSFLSACAEISDGRLENHAVDRSQSTQDTTAYSVRAGSETSLETLISLAIESNPQSLAARSEIDVAIADLQAAKLSSYPTPSASFDVTEDGEPEFRVGLEQPLWTAGRLRANKAGAEIRETVSHLEYAAVKKSLAISVVDRYGAWLQAHLTEKAWRQALQQQTEFLEVIQRRANSGFSSTNQVILAELRVDSTLSSLLSAQIDSDINLSELSLLSGQTLDGVRLQQKIATPKAVPKSLEQLKKMADENSPEIKISAANVLLAENERIIVKSRAWPQLWARAEHIERPNASSGLRSDSRLFVGFRTDFGPGFSWKGDVQRVAAQIRAAEAERLLAERIVRQQVEQSLLVYRNSRNRLDKLAETIKRSQEIVVSYKRQFVTGHRDWEEVMSAIEELAQLQVGEAEFYALVIQSSWRLDILTSDFSASKVAQQ